jgi:hypothetical protein
MNNFSVGRTFIAFIVSHAHIQLSILCAIVWCADEPKHFIIQTYWDCFTVVGIAIQFVTAYNS